MRDTKIRWAEHTWNPISGCSHVSAGCDHCYAETITLKFKAGFPNGFKPTFKPHMLAQPRKWKQPARIFCNSMSDPFHVDFTDEQRDAIFDVMLEVDRHDYLVLTKRPQLLARYFNGPDGYLARRGLVECPAQMWLGTTIEDDRYTFRTKHLTAVPAVVHFLSLEPLLGPLPSLDLTDIEWCIVGGESGPGFRPMDHDWARDLRDRCNDADVALFFKQSAAWRTEMGMDLDGRRWEEYPLAHPADRTEDVVGRYVGRHHEETGTPVTISQPSLL